MLWFDLIDLLPLLMIGVHLHALILMVMDYSTNCHQYQTNRCNKLPDFLLISPESRLL